jgi:hypothetical protein
VRRNNPDLTCGTINRFREGNMRRDRWTLGLAAVLAGLSAGPAIAQEAGPRADEIAGKMGGVVDELGRKKTGEPVQAVQKTIVRDLDALIAELEKQAQAARNGIKRNDPRDGMRDSTISAGTGGIGTLVNPDDGGKDWGKLSDRERDRILQSMTEGFPPEYRTVLERYYRRLAEEKSAKSPGPKKAGDAAPEAGRR